MTNERIDELRKQAAREVSNANQWTNDDEWNELFMEKFAELIVRECVQVAHPKLNDVGEWAAGMRLVQKRIKQHFGVEE
jgi:hypothetical protein